MKYTRRSVLSAVGASVVAGCSSAQSPSSGEKSTTTEPERTNLLLNWNPSGLHVPYYAARAQGYYEDHGLRLQSIETGQGSDFSAQQAGLGNKDFVVTSADQVLAVRSKGLDVLSVGVVMQRSPVVLFSTRETFGGELTDVSQLAGKTVGTGPGMVRILSKLMLEDAGVLEDVELVDTGYDTVQQLLAGKIDAAGGVFGDAISAQAQGYTTDSLPVASAVPSYGHVIATSSGFAEENPDLVRSFLRGTARGAAWASTNPEAATGVLVDENGALAETQAQQRQKWTSMAEQFMVSETVEERGWGVARGEPWRITADALRDADLLDGAVDPTAVWTNDYVDTDYEYIGSYTSQVSAE